MTKSILTQNEKAVKITEPTLLHLRVYDAKGEWFLEAVFEGGNKVTGWLSADTVNDLESDLEARGWDIDPSLFHRGFNAKPPVIEEFIFAIPELWPDDCAIEPWI